MPAPTQQLPKGWTKEDLDRFLGKGKAPPTPPVPEKKAEEAPAGDVFPHPDEERIEGLDYGDQRQQWLRRNPKGRERFMQMNPSKEWSEEKQDFVKKKPDYEITGVEPSTRTQLGDAVESIQKTLWGDHSKVKAWEDMSGFERRGIVGEAVHQFTGGLISPDEENELKEELVRAGGGMAGMWKGMKIGAKRGPWGAVAGGVLGSTLGYTGTQFLEEGEVPTEGRQIRELGYGLAPAPVKGAKALQRMAGEGARLGAQVEMAEQAESLIDKGEMLPFSPLRTGTAVGLGGITGSLGGLERPKVKPKVSEKDEGLIREGMAAAKRQKVEDVLTPGAKTLNVPQIKQSQFNREQLLRMKFPYEHGDPFLKYERALEKALAEAAGEVAPKAGADRSAAVRKAVMKKLQPQESSLAKEANKAYEAAMRGVGAQVQPPSGMVLRDVMLNARKATQKVIAANKVTEKKRYAALIAQLPEEPFVQLDDSFLKALREWEESLPTVLKAQKPGKKPKVTLLNKQGEDLATMLPPEKKKEIASMFAEIKAKINKYKEYSTKPHTFEEAQRIKSDIGRELGNFKKNMMVVAPGHEMKDFSTLYGSLKDDVSKSIRNLHAGNAAYQIKLNKLADDLDELQAWKKKNIDIFERTDPWFQKLTREVTEGGQLEVAQLGRELLQDGGRLETLVHLKTLMPEGYDALRVGLQDEILNAPLTFQTRSGQNLVDLEIVAKQLKKLDKGFKDELFGSSEAVASLEKALDDFIALKGKNNTFGEQAVIKQEDLLNIADALLHGPAQVRTVVKEVKAALKAEARRTQQFDNDLYAAFKYSDVEGISLLKDNKEDFVEYLVFRSKNPELVKRWVEVLPPDMKKELSDEVANHIFTKTLDIARSPERAITRGYGLKPGVVDPEKAMAIEVKYPEWMTLIYGNERQRRILESVLEPKKIEQLDDWTAIFKLLEREREIGGAVGTFGAETSQPMMATAQLKALKARFLLSDPIQSFITGGAHNPEGFSQIMAALGKFNQQALPKAGVLAKETLAARGVPESTLRLLNLYLKANEDVPEFRELMEPNAAGSREESLEEWEQLLREQEQKEEE